MTKIDVWKTSWNEQQMENIYLSPKVARKVYIDEKKTRLIGDNEHFCVLRKAVRPMYEFNKKTVLLVHIDMFDWLIWIYSCYMAEVFFSLSHTHSKDKQHVFVFVLFLSRNLIWKNGDLIDSLVINTYTKTDSSVTEPACLSGLFYHNMNRRSSFLTYDCENEWSFAFYPSIQLVVMLVFPNK